MTLRCFIARTNGTITLPATALYTIWIWGAGGPGGNGGSASIGGGGGGGGGFDQVEIFGTIADELTIHLGDGTAGSAAPNDTWVQLEDDTYAVRVGSGSSAVGVGAGYGGYAPNNISGTLNGGAHGGAFGSGGGGGSSGGPKSGTATGASGGIGRTFGTPGGGGGAGAHVGQVPAESQATWGDDGDATANGGFGYYGTGRGLGGVSPTAGTTNLGGGGGGSLSSGVAGAAGSSWDYILGLDGDEWIDCPFTYSDTASGYYSVISNGTVPAGAGGGGGCRDNGAGGAGGFPGGGGGGAGYGGAGDSLGGTGGDGLVIIFYSTDGVSTPPIEEGPTPSVGEDDVVSYEARTYITKVRQLRPNPRPPFNEYAVGATERTTFPVSFRIMEQANLRVTIDDVELDQGDFVFTGRSVERIPGYETGRVTLDTAVSNCLVRIWSDPIPARETDLIPNVV